jgi:two-component system cell cycle sensor histidine kinase/response regulator CckA
MTVHEKAPQSRAELKFRALFERAGLGIALCTTDGHIAANPVLAEMLGYSVEELRGIPFADFTCGEDLAAGRELAIKLGRGEIDRYSIEKRCVRKDGAPLWCMLTITLTAPPTSPGSLGLAIAYDITDGKRAEDALRESEERFRSLSNLAREGIMIHERGVILDSNLTFARLFGYEHPEELIGKNGLELLLTPESRVRVRQRMERRETGLIEVTGLRKDGSTFVGGTDSRPVKYLRHDATLVSLFDITERKRTEAERAYLEEQLRQAQKMESIGRLAGGVAHDFNNHLTIIISCCHMMLAQLDSQHPMVARIQQVLRAADQSARLTQQLLAFSRKQILQPKILCLNDLVVDTVRMLDRLIGEDVELATSLDPALDFVLADPGQINQVLMNLAANARDAMPSGGRITIETSNVVVGEDCVNRHQVKPGSYALITVADNGTGMDRATLDRIFEPFFTTKTAELGTGLGLATVYGIVRQSGGFIWAHSEPGQGTTFNLYFPRVDAQVEAVPEPASALDTPGGDETILVVEDHEDLRLLAVSILERLGYHVLCAANGVEAIEKSGSHAGPIHLMISDVVMPGMTGSDLAQHMAELRPKMKVLFTSGYTANVIARQGVFDSGVTYLPKPFTPTQLAEKVRSILSNARQQKREEKWSA